MKKLKCPACDYWIWEQTVRSDGYVRDGYRALGWHIGQAHPDKPEPRAAEAT